MMCPLYALLRQKGSCGCRYSQTIGEVKKLTSRNELVPVPVWVLFNLNLSLSLSVSLSLLTLALLYVSSKMVGLQKPCISETHTHTRPTMQPGVFFQLRRQSLAIDL